MYCTSIHPRSNRMRKTVFLLIFFLLLLSGCNTQPTVTDFQDLDVIGSMSLQYAEQFCVDYLEDGCSLVTIKESGSFLIVPEGQEPPLNVDTSITVLQQPIENIYLQATSAMCLFDALDALEHISMSGTQADGWYIENAKAAMESGEIVYAGKYSSPDYEMLMAKNCGLAIESTMILHTPEVKEKLELLGIPVMVERSSYETHPLGRTEWIKLYGLLCNEEELAEALFDEQAAYLNNISSASTGKTVAFFYISSTGAAVVRKSGDYTVKMIELAGGEYVFSDLGDPDSATGSVNLEMEQFYAEAKDADIIIYNSSIDGQVYTVEELLAKNHLLAEFRAVKNGDVWCTSKNFFQETTEFGLMISDMNQIFKTESGDETQINYYYRLR